MKYTKIDQKNFISNIKKLNIQLDYKLIKKATSFAVEAHLGQKRNSGEEYIIHSLNVAYILAEMNMDSSLIIAAILHDVLEDTPKNYNELENIFGLDIAKIVDGVTKISDYHFTEKKSFQEKQAENFRKLLISITNDIRVIIVKLADRLHNMRTIKYLKKEKQKRIAKETLSIYAPLANRFGLIKIKNELEDRALKCLDYKTYQYIYNMIKQKSVERSYYINQKIVIPLKEYLKQHDIKTEILGRSKHFYSIYRKHKVRGVAYDEIFDLYAIRIICDSKENCYRCFGIVHSKYKPLNIVKDYIANPKPNGYMSLHTIVFGPFGKKIEIQIRTKNMDKIAQDGVAAHWYYKENVDYSKRGVQKQRIIAEKEDGVRHQIVSIRNFLKHNNTNNSNDFLENLQLDLYPDIIIVLTPAGDLINLPVNSTPIDFAFYIHTQVGSRCVGCRINGKMKSIRTILHSGDKIEIITSKFTNISKDWLSFVKTSKAKSKIRNYINKIELEDAIELGKQIFEKKCRKSHWKLKKEEQIMQVAKLFNFNNVQTFFAAIGKGNLLFSLIKEKYEKKLSEQKSSQRFKSFYKPTIAKLNNVKAILEKIKGIKVGDQTNLMISYANCCHPIPGDKIVGYTTRGRGITIHKQLCSDNNFKNLKKTQPERMIKVEWDYSFKKRVTHKNKINVKIEIIARNRDNILLDIISKMAKLNVSIYKSNNLLINEYTTKIILFFYIASNFKLEQLRIDLKEMSDILDIKVQENVDSGN